MSEEEEIEESEDEEGGEPRPGCSGLQQKGQGLARSINNNAHLKNMDDDWDTEEERSMMKFARFLEKRGFIQQTPDRGPDDKKQKKQGKQGKCLEVVSDNSITTVYKEAVPLELDGQSLVEYADGEVKFNYKRPSTSSDEMGYTSDDLEISPNTKVHSDNLEVMSLLDKEREQMLFHKFLDCRLSEFREQQRQQERQTNKGDGGKRTKGRGVNKQPNSGSEDEDVEQLGREETRRAESVKAHINEVAGKTIGPNLLFGEQEKLAHSLFVDEEYSMVGEQIDNNLRERIREGAYVDFVRLIPHDRLDYEEDQRMEMVNRNGLSYWVPLKERDSTSINNFQKWEQAFRIFSKIYTEKFPEKATELIQYNCIIHSASLSFTWENVYSYDRDFRLHMSRHPDRTWSVILQQAWSLRLRDRLGVRGSTGADKTTPMVRSQRTFVINITGDVVHMALIANLITSVQFVVSGVMEHTTAERLVVRKGKNILIRKLGSPTEETIQTGTVVADQASKIEEVEVKEGERKKESDKANFEQCGLNIWLIENLRIDAQMLSAIDFI